VGREIARKIKEVDLDAPLKRREWTNASIATTENLVTDKVLEE
jgi:hypothetical protein